MSMLQERVATFISDVDLVHEIANGDATTVVTTEGGPVRSVAKLIADKDAQINAGLSTLPLVGLSLASSAPVTALDSILSAIGKIQAKIVALAAFGGAALVGFRASGTGAVDRTLQDKAREWVSAADLGLLGDGSDETTAFSRVLNDPRDIQIDAGSYVVNAGAITVSAGVAKKVTGRGVVTISCSLPANTNLATFSRAVSFDNVIFDFNNSYAKIALQWLSDCGGFSLKRLTFRNLKDIDNTYASFLIYINPQGNIPDIDGITFDTLKKRGNGSIADSAGSLNCIYIGGTGAYIKGVIRRISLNEVHNIDASDVIIYEDTGGIYVATPSTDALNELSISDVSGYNFGKRLLKIHASNVAVSNVTGTSIEGDSTGVINFLSGQGLGNKYGCSASHVRAYGKMEFAFSSDAIGTKWKDVIDAVTPGTKAGMSSAAVGIFITADHTSVEGHDSSSSRSISLGSSAQIVKNTTLKNLKFLVTSLTTYCIQNTQGTLGFDGLFIDGVHATHDATSLGVPVIQTDLYLNGTTVKGRNVTVNNVQIDSAGPISSYGLSFKYIENISLTNFRYANISGTTHFRLAIFDTCKNVNVDSVVIEGATQHGVFLSACTGRNTVNRVEAPNATFNSVYNSNSADVIVQNCDPAKVGGVTTATPMNAKWVVCTTAARPTTGLVVGLSQCWDSTLAKPIWWNGTVWKDATGATV